MSCAISSTAGTTARTKRWRRATTATAPHDSIIHKYAIKALNGLRHSYAFTTGNHPEPIRITALNREVTEHACRSCHGDLTSMIAHNTSEEPTACLRCHPGVGHGK